MNIFTNIKNLFTDKQIDIINNDDIDNVLVLDNPEELTDLSLINDNHFNSYASQISFDSKAENIKQLILEYRNLALKNEIDSAINEIVNEAIVMEEDILQLDFNSDTVIKEALRKRINEEFREILRMLDFKNTGDELFRQWYEDGRLYVQKLIDLNNTKKGIEGVKILSPLMLKRVLDRKENKIFFHYTNEKDKVSYKIPEEHITFVDSGLKNESKEIFISYLHKAIKPYNQLRYLEDSAVIYRITRAPERRVFYVDVGKMNKSKAEEYMTRIMSKFKNKISYDANSGKVSQRSDVMTMAEDFWLPSSEAGSGSRGTKIETLPSGQNLGEMGDIEYFRRNLLKALRVPYSRFDSDNPASMAFGNMNAEMSRDEVRFNKFIIKLRNKFSWLFLDILKSQLILKNVIKPEEWFDIVNDITFIWNSDSYFTEVKNSEILKMRVEVIDAIENKIGKYFSHSYVLKDILNLSDKEIEQMQKEIEDESENTIFNPPQDDKDF